ncbi:glycosyltransferase [Streptomyces sp. NBC_00059]|uniref:glycosyltransferase n=1 Tax=Streptomyces sp. NBC_00059 TaxID=2975635 RepID=UPI0022509A78|nr:glycosyltransferase [Streptomyces sp. NBC_00059]MCX5415998.1 glycosyltransferase [Streptomyces sp. NBC_00059]
MVIPTYNRAEFLRMGLLGLSRQSIPNEQFEVIVADDGSSDGTAEVVASFADSLRLTYYFQEDKGFRVAKARNEGARLAEGSILIFLDTGTLVGPDFVRHHLEAYADESSRQAVIGYAYAYRPEDPTPDLAETVSRLRPEEVVEHYGDDPQFRDIRHDAFTDCGFEPDRRAVPWILYWGTNCSVRAKDFWAVGGFDEDFCHWGVEDMEFGLRLHRAGVSLLALRQAWAIEGPHERDMADHMATNKINALLLLEKYPEPLCEIGWSLIMKDLLWPWEEEYRALDEWTAKAWDIPVAQEIAEALADLPHGSRAAVFGCGSDVQGLPPDTVLVDFDREVIDRIAAAGHHEDLHHAIGMRTLAAEASVSRVVVTSRLRGVWNRWAREILTEAHRLGEDVRVTWPTSEEGRR